MRSISIYAPMYEIFPFLNSGEDNILLFGEYLLEKISNIIDAVAIKTEENWLGLCRYCGAIDLDDNEKRYEFYTYHNNHCWLAGRETKTEIDFLQCLRE